MPAWSKQFFENLNFSDDLPIAILNKPRGKQQVNLKSLAQSVVVVITPRTHTISLNHLTR